MREEGKEYIVQDGDIMEFPLMSKINKWCQLGWKKFQPFGFERKINDQITCRLGKSRDKYFETKHNVGFMLIDQLAKKQNVTFTHDKIFQADLASFFPKWRKNLSG